MILAASNPSITGILMSIITTSGLSERVSSSAFWPSAASPTTAKPHLLQKGLRSMRMIDSSSAMTILIWLMLILRIRMDALYFTILSAWYNHVKDTHFSGCIPSNELGATPYEVRLRGLHLQSDEVELVPVASISIEGHEDSVKGFRL